MPTGTIDIRKTFLFSLAAALMVACWPSMATAQFARFVNETLERSDVANSLFASDGEEKDYTWGDLDNDGDIDLVIVRKEPFSTAGKRVNLLLINEDGVLVDRTTQFATASDVPGDQGFDTPTNDRDVILVDVNGDGWLDIVTATTLTDNQAKHISHPRVYINLGDNPPGSGNWQGLEYQEARIPEMHPTAGPRFCEMAVGDVTGDGAPDLYFADYDSGVPGQSYDYQNKLLVNDGTGFFFDESELRMGSLFNYGGNVGVENYLYSAFGTGAAIGDMNNDGVNDVVKASALGDPYHMAVIYNDPANEGFFDHYDLPDIPGPYFISIGHLNNDDILDIVATLDGVDRYLIGTTLDANGHREYADFTFPPNSSGFGGNSVIADLNNDGLNDVVIAGVDVHNSGCNATTHVNRNLGGDPPTFSSVESTVGIPEAMLKGGHDVAIFDLNGDGWPDIIHGRCAGTEIWIQHPFGVIFDYPQSLPDIVTLNESFTFQVQLTPVGGTVAPGTATLHHAVNDEPFTSVLMADLGGDLYEATLPPAGCLDRINFYFTVDMVEDGVSSTDPPDAPANTYTVVAAAGLEITHLYNFEANEDLSDWTIFSDPSLTAGEWELADPNGTIWFGQAAPDDDATPGDGNVIAFVTDNGPPGGSPGANDVDGGPTYLTSPAFDLQDGNAMISYARWFFSLGGTTDLLAIEVSNDGIHWVLVENVSGTGSAWETASLLVSDYVVPSDSVQVRFSTSDLDSSITEAGIDDFQVEEFSCEDDGEPCGDCPTDANGDGETGPFDLATLLAAWGPVDPGNCLDANGDGDMGPLDLATLLAAWGSCP